jgi:geranylgeranyl diphosphate synthase type II
MQSFKDLLAQFDSQFSNMPIPAEPPTLYDSCRYFLSIGGKRVRPVSLLMANELFGELQPQAFHAANAIELFHNFTLMHDDIMDKAPLRRGLPTVPAKYGDNTALLGGDVMLILAYEQLNKVSAENLSTVIALFNLTARQVCEGQQLDMDFEQRPEVHFDEYLHMITLKTSVLLAASLRIGAIIGGAGLGNQDSIYKFGKNLGIAFQIQDDYLDAFGDPDKFGKQVGGDILANKKTFLLIHALEAASPEQKKELLKLLAGNSTDKVDRVLEIFKDCGVDAWAQELKETYYEKALKHLEEMAVITARKYELEKLAGYLMQRVS